MLILSLMAAAIAKVDAAPVDCGAAAPAFMKAYAAELAAGDRRAIAGRYSSRGAYSLGLGAKRFESHRAIAQRYADDSWQKPDAFAWRDLSYEQLGADTCLVVGGFEWTAGKRTAQLAYTAVLHREEDALRIMLEHENVIGAPGSE